MDNRQVFNIFLDLKHVAMLLKWRNCVALFLIACIQVVKPHGDQIKWSAQSVVSVASLQ